MRALGWAGPDPGGKHPVMIKAERSVSIPNPHGNDLDWTVVKRVLKQAGIDANNWEKLGE